MYYKIKEVADMTGVSVRMLHHYDKLGLLKPESVSPAGYRLYSTKDLERLQQDLRFTENIDRHKPGLACFLRDAIHVHCDRLKDC